MSFNEDSRVKIPAILSAQSRGIESDVDGLFIAAEEGGEYGR